ncbi:hypothetical protein GH733_014064 [Mirounga leonina]|nr:hypothetical protein GH733_014064 [Mirounga leonina]
MGDQIPLPTPSWHGGRCKEEAQALVSNLALPRSTVKLPSANVGGHLAAGSPALGNARKRWTISIGELALEGQLQLEPSADTGLTFVEETLLPIQSSASAPRPPRSFLPLGDGRGTGQRLDLPSPAPRDSLGSDTEWGGVYSYPARAPLHQANLDLERPLAVLGGGPGPPRAVRGFGLGPQKALPGGGALKIIRP